VTRPRVVAQATDDRQDAANSAKNEGEVGGAARPITARQLEILTYVARGRTNRQIGESLGISERTVRNHMRAILQRLSSSDRTHAVVLAIGNGWIAVPIEPESSTDTVGGRVPRTVTTSP